MAASLIEVYDLRKIYTMGDVEVHALRGLSLCIEPGEFVAVMGSSGSGKSTLMNVIGCLDRPTSGTYLLDGSDVSGLTKNQLAEVRNRKIGFVFQQFNLLARTTALDNVELPLLYDPSVTPEERHTRGRRYLEMLGLGTRADHFPNQLSGGQQQRVAIARALVNRPVLLLADEPTGNLDSRTSVEIMGIFQRLNEEEGLTIVVVTHERDIAEYTKRNVVFRDGQIIEDTQVRKRRWAKDELKQMPPLDGGQQETARAAAEPH